MTPLEVEENDYESLHVVQIIICENSWRNIWQDYVVYVKCNVKKEKRN